MDSVGFTGPDYFWVLRPSNDALPTERVVQVLTTHAGHANASATALAFRVVDRLGG